MSKFIKYVVLLLVLMVVVGACGGTQQAVPTAEKSASKINWAGFTITRRQAS